MNNARIQISALLLMCLVVVSMVTLSVMLDGRLEQSKSTRVEELIAHSIDANESMAQGLPKMLPIKMQTNGGLETESFYTLTSNESHSSTSDGYDPLKRLKIPQPTDKTFGEASPSFDWLDPNISLNKILETANVQGRDWVYGWLQLRTGFNRHELGQKFQKYDISLLGLTGLYARVRLPASEEQLKGLASEPDISGFGLKSSDLKIDQNLDEIVSKIDVLEQLPVFVTVLANDDIADIRQSLSDQGVAVGQWFGDIRSYSANLPIYLIDKVVLNDYVEEVSFNGLVSTLLDSANAAVGVDRTREYQNASDTFGSETGRKVAVGVLDTGINADHFDFSSKNICAVNFISNAEIDQQDLFIDEGGHGSHVTGIIAGEGRGNMNYAGVAPGIKQLRIAKVLAASGRGTLLDVFNAVGFMFESEPCRDGTSTIVPSVVNVSLGADSDFSDGKALFNRKLDSSIFELDQSFVIAAGNSGSAGITNIASTKNAIVVGAVHDNGVITDFSSHGPTADGRLSPHIVAPGSLVTSIEGEGSVDGYIEHSGTSMATPMVTGIIALALGSNDWTPAQIRAVLMAEAVKPNPLVGLLGGFAANNTNGPGILQAEYGMGVVTTSDEWIAGDEYAGEMSSTDDFTQTLTIPSGVARLDVVLTWVEPPATAFSDTVLANFDLYVDVNSDCGPGACGEHSSRSSIDNNEWVLLKNPPPGEYTIKVIPVNDFASTMKIGLAWRAIEGEESPQLAIVASDTQLEVSENDSVEVDLTVSVSEYIASGTTVHLVCVGGNVCSAYGSEESIWHPVSRVTHADGTFQELDRNALSVPISVGEVTKSEGRVVRLRIPRGVITDSHTIYFVASSINAQSAVARVDIQVDDGSGPSPEVDSPINDAMANAVVFEGEEGDFRIDLRLASREPGELMVRGDRSGGTIKKFFKSNQDSLSQEEYSEYSRYASVWYELTTQSDNAVLTIENHPVSSSFALYEVTTDGALLVYSRFVERNSVSDFSVQVKGSVGYLIQITNLVFDSSPEKVSWSFGKDIPPANDNFNNAEQIVGDSGSVAGTNFNSTLESFEFYGTKDSESTWFKWIAPVTDTFRFNASPAKVLVFSGNNRYNLSRVSSIPVSTTGNFIRARQNELYYIAVVSNPENGNVNHYELAWGEASRFERDYLFANNDNFETATTITGSSGSVDTNVYSLRTVEPDEPIQTGLGSLWWKWTPDASGQYTFSLENVDVEHLSVFSGMTLEDLTFSASGREFSFAVSAGESYYISHGIGRRFRFHDLDGNVTRSIKFSWGVAPENDRRVDAIALSGEAGEVSFTHENATSSVDDPRTLLGSHSLWWKWTVPSTGWYEFELEHEKGVPLSERRVDNVLGILRTEDGSDLIANSDRSYILSGIPEATIYAIEDQEYLIEVVVRTETSSEPFEDSSFRWTSTVAPAWLRYQEKLVSAARSDPEEEVAALFEPRSIALDAKSNTIYVLSHNEVLVFSVDEATGSLEFIKGIAYVDQSQNLVAGLNRSILSWDGSRSNLYAVNGSSLYLLQNLDSDSPHFDKCLDFEDPYYYGVSQLLVDTDSSFFYFVGNDFGLEISVYERNDVCSFSTVQRLTSNDRRTPADRRELDRGSSALMGPTQQYVYVTTYDGLLTYSRDAESGELDYLSFAETSNRKGRTYKWDASSMQLSPSGNHLFVAGESAPYLALYDIQSEPQNPSLVSSIAEFYADPADYDNRNFKTRENLPVSASDCVLFGVSKETEGVHLLCNQALFSLTFVDDELRLVDMLLESEYDRFRNNLRDVSFKTRGFTQAVVHDNHRVYVIVDDLIDSLLTFELASNIEQDPY